MPTFPLEPDRRRPLLVLLIALCAAFGATPAVAAAQALQDEVVGPQEDPFAGKNIVAIEVVGQRRYTRANLLNALGLNVGDTYSAAQVGRGIVYLWSIYQVRASVDRKLVEGGVALRLTVTELPLDLEPRIIGNAEIDLEDILEWAQMEDRRELYLHEVNRVSGRILEGYRREGYYHAEIRTVIREPEEGDDPDQIGDVIFEIIEGPQVNVKDVVIHGNVSLPDRGALFWKDGLKHLSGIELEGPWLFDWNGKEFVEETLQADLLAMRNVYRDRGFLNAVVELDRLDFSDDRTGVVVHLIVDEGEPFIVTDVSIRAFGLTPSPLGAQYLPQETPAELYYPEEELLAALALAPGRRYEQVWVTADHGYLRDFYGADGYIEHRSLGSKYSWQWLDPELIFDLDQAEVQVIYRIAQGEKVFIREVKVSGASHTKDRIIRGEISVEPGRQANMKQIRSSIRRITTLGYFSNDRDPLGHRDPYFRFIPTGEPGVVDIEFIVEEGRVVDFGISGGIDSNTGLFGLIQLGMRNFDITDLPDSFLGSFGEIYRKEAFHGAGQTLEIMVSPGTERDQMRIRFVEPDIFRTYKKRWSFDGELAKYDNIRFDYEEKRIIRGFAFGHQLGYNSRMSIGFRSEDVTVYNVDPSIDLTDPDLLPLAAQVGTSSINGITMRVWSRDTDAAFNPRDGHIISLATEVHAHQIGSDWEYLKSTFSWDEYWKAWWSDDEVPPAFKLSTGAGFALPFGRSEFIPYTERYFLGGFSTLRGFRYRGVGPYSDDGVPLGGETTLDASIEYRIPLFTTTVPGSFQKREMFRLGFFVDSGVLNPQYDVMDFNETRVSAGVGFGLMQPFPLVFNFAWPLRSDVQDRTQVFSFNLAIN